MFFHLSLIFLLRYASPANTNNNLQNVKADWLNQIGSFNCDVCIQAARTQSVDCRLPDADVSDGDRARNMWITRKP